MMTIRGRNVNDVYVNGLHYMKVSGISESSRLGSVLVAPGPVMSVYELPKERVLFDHLRHANPFFHLAECVWMLAGSKGIRWLAQFNKQMLAYSDDGVTSNGAYGYRWRYHFKGDQIMDAIQKLRRNHKDRKVVITMWEPLDLVSQSADVPCNTHIYLRIQPTGHLDLTVCCRSNDIIWGAYGANAVHFSFLQEFIAGALGVDVGQMYQLSNNYHIYKHHWNLLEFPVLDINPYETRHVQVIPVMTPDDIHKPVGFFADCEGIVAGHPRVPENYFLREVCRPMFAAWHSRNTESSRAFLSAMPDCDWKVAGQEWLVRRNAKRGENAN